MIALKDKSNIKILNRGNFERRYNSGLGKCDGFDQLIFCTGQTHDHPTNRAKWMEARDKAKDGELGRLSNVLDVEED